MHASKRIHRGDATARWRYGDKESGFVAPERAYHPPLPRREPDIGFDAPLEPVTRPFFERARGYVLMLCFPEAGSESAYGWD